MKNSKEATALLNGDQAGIQLIYKEYYPKMEAQMLNWRATKETSQDIFQEALLVIYKKLKTPNFNLTSSFYTFLYAVCRNILRDEKKKKRNSEVTLDDSILSIDNNTVENSIHEHRRQTFFQSKFKLLKDDCRKLFRLYFEGKSMREISEKMNSTEGYIRKKKHGCKKKLMELITEDPLFEELKGV